MFKYIVEISSLIGSILGILNTIVLIFQFKTRISINVISHEKNGITHGKVVVKITNKGNKSVNLEKIILKGLEQEGKKEFNISDKPICKNNLSYEILSQKSVEFEFSPEDTLRANLMKYFYIQVHTVIGKKFCSKKYTRDINT